jgi:DNA replication protein DnaC
MSALLEKVKQGFNDGESDQVKKTAADAWERAKTAELLVLDDIGAERPTEWAQDQIQGLVDYRYMHELPILMATNIPPRAWDDTFGPRTASRMRGMTLPFELGGKDLRTELGYDPVTGEVK